MQYIGGKSRIAKEIVATIAPVAPRSIPIDTVWEPFCGGLSVSYAFALAGVRRMICSDLCRPLIALYQAVREGWIPPMMLSEGEYAAARALPDTHPLKAFAGFGCSFGGKWFGGYARQERGSTEPQKKAAACARSLLKVIPALPCGDFINTSFLDQKPSADAAAGTLIYCDPPYEGTQGYIAANGGKFDHDLFWDLCIEWAALGAEVWVSEYRAPDEFVELRWSKRHALALAGGMQLDAREECLFKVKGKP